MSYPKTVLKWNNCCGGELSIIQPTDENVVWLKIEGSLGNGRCLLTPDVEAALLSVLQQRAKGARDALHKNED